MAASVDTFGLLLADACQAGADLLAEALWEPYPWQQPPGVVETHGAFLIEGGRGIGKTDGCAHYVDAHVNGPPCDPRWKGGHRVAIIAPTLDDAAESCVSGPSGLQAVNPTVTLSTKLGGSKAVWPSGAEAKLFSGSTQKDVDRLRAGGNRCLAWVEEAAAIPYLGPVLKQTRYGLRVRRARLAYPVRPHIVASSTPRPTLEYREFRSAPSTLRTHGTTGQAVHLDPAVAESLYRDYAGTRLGRQELLGELLEDVEGALWSWPLIEACHADPPDRGQWWRTVVALDPSDGLADGDEQALAVVTAASDRLLHVMVSEGMRVPVTAYLRRAVELAREYDAMIVAEKNHGGAYLTATLDQVMREERVIVPYGVVDASEGKRTRAEPVAALYEQGRVKHCGVFTRLEDQMTSFTGLGGGGSPDRLDALVWGVRHLMGYTYPDSTGPGGGDGYASWDLYAELAS